LKRHPVIVYWERSGKTESFESIKSCADSLKTSTSQIKRLIKSGNSFKRGNDYCIIDESV